MDAAFFDSQRIALRRKEPPTASSCSPTTSDANSRWPLPRRRTNGEAVCALGLAQLRTRWNGHRHPARSALRRCSASLKDTHPKRIEDLE